MAWYTIHSVSKAECYKQITYAKEGRRSRYHGNMGLKKPRETTRQSTTILATIIVPLANVMPHKTYTLASVKRLWRRFFPHAQNGKTYCWT